MCLKRQFYRFYISTKQYNRTLDFFFKKKGDREKEKERKTEKEKERGKDRENIVGSKTEEKEQKDQ